MYVIECRGTQSYGARVISPRSGNVLQFGTREAARDHADSIKSEMPSKFWPLVVVHADFPSVVR